MNTMKRRVKTLTLIALLMGYPLVAKTASATIRCETQYGGGQTCEKIGNLLVDKKVFDPDNNKFVDNLLINDFKFAADDEIRFKIVVKNTGDAKLTQIKIKDVLPEKLYFVNGPASWTDWEMTFTIDGLEVGETKEYEIRAKVVPANELPEKNILCKLNAVEAVSGDQKDRDTAQVCLEKKVLAKVLPETGPSVLPILFFVSLIIAGLFLNKKALLKT